MAGRGILEKIGPKDPKEEEKGKIYDATGLGPALKSGSSDNFHEKIETILKELVKGLGTFNKPFESKMSSYVMGDGQYQWLVHHVVPKNEVVAGWQDLLTLAKDQLSLKKEEAATYMEQFRGLNALVANLHLLRKTGPAKQYLEVREGLEQMVRDAAELESRAKELGTFGYWVQEFQEGKKYAVYPYPSVLEVKGTSKEGRVSSVTINMSPRLLENERGVFHKLCATLGERLQNEYKWLDVHIGYSDSVVLYTQPLSEVRAKEAAKKEPEKKPKGRTTWP